jgi:hypothetical protein
MRPTRRAGATERPGAAYCVTGISPNPAEARAEFLRKDLLVGMDITLSLIMDTEGRKSPGYPSSYTAKL